MKKVFAVILNYNGYDDTIRCLKSIQNSSYKAVYSVIVDNASPDGSGERLKNELSASKNNGYNSPEITVILNSKNLGYAGGMNTGARYALEHGADFVMYVNNDTEFTETTIQEMAAVADKDEKTGIVSPKVLYMDEREKIYCAGSRYLFYRCGNVSLGRGTDAKNNRNTEEEITHAEGACLLIKKEVFLQVGFMKEFFFMYFEDLEYSLRVNRKFKIVYAPKAVLYHSSGAGKSFGDYSALYHYYFTRNRFLIFKDHNLAAKLYVILYSAAISAIKSVSVILSSDRKVESLISLWNGFLTGLEYLLKLKKLDESKPLIR
ncbi:MAG: glycosyltransferase family 2 protein [Ignavibacteriales bacterium]|nr:hypothetical protein [Ignavibacteriaceae bacterium]MBW7873940.1 glycosyltransferase family 2 protein [Ignavibacteria bacterium]MBZ0196201.1 glycosyltransferase family 2 protein [Ignavibacteriaceae bacterium]MCZ2143301.1 glycosyltransferase family 2 protein [Ignavibacteriales bacterium]WKZ72372.1 MAG: glycosyltransferase family 2 protein [Ignavibacteriaceae bacterium]